MKFSNKVVLGGLAAATIALAAPVSSYAQAGRGDTGWYIGGTIGQSKFKDCAGCSDDKDTAFRILGGYQINRNFAAEIGYHDLGKISVGGGDIKANAWELVGIGAWPVANQFSVYGKLGFYRGEVKGFGAKDTNNDLTYGLGVRYDIQRNFGVRAEWQTYKDVGDSDSDVQVLSVGVIWKFQ